MSVAHKIRLRQLRCFVGVARKKSFVLAAEELGLTQPAVSRSVRELEHVLGHPLFDRSTRGAALTPRGEAFLEAAENGLLRIAQGADAVNGRIGENEVVRVGALPNVCSRFLPPIVHTFKQHYPHVLVRLRPGTNMDLLASLKRGETDFVIGRLSSSEDMKGLVFEALFDEPLVFVVRADHPLTNGKPALESVLDFPMLMPPQGTIIRQEASRFLASQGMTQLNDIIETTSSEFQRAYLNLTQAVAVIPRGVFQAELERGTFVALDIGADEMRGPVGLTTNPELQQGAATEQLLHLVRRAV